MIIHILDRDFLVLYTVKGEGQELQQHICRDVNESSDRTYRALRIPAEHTGGALIRYLMEQVHNRDFREFADYSTDGEGVTVFMDCGCGTPLSERLSRETLRLGERLALAEKLTEHLVLGNFPAYFIHAAMEPGRVKVTDAMDFGFDFELADLLSWQETDFAMACRDMGKVFSALFEPELARRAFPDMESFLYGLDHGEFENTLQVYERLEAICRQWKDRDETALESRSFAFRLWERLKGLGRFLMTFAKLAVILLAAGYLAYSVYGLIQPEPAGQGYERIGNLEIRKNTEAETP